VLRGVTDRGGQDRALGLEPGERLTAVGRFLRGCAERGRRRASGRVDVVQVRAAERFQESERVVAGSRPGRSGHAPVGQVGPAVGAEILKFGADLVGVGVVQVVEDV
jgi:hypothetical protein